MPTERTTSISKRQNNVAKGAPRLHRKMILVSTRDKASPKILNATKAISPQLPPDRSLKKTLAAPGASFARIASTISDEMTARSGPTGNALAGIKNNKRIDGHDSSAPTAAAADASIPPPTT